MIEWTPTQRLELVHRLVAGKRFVSSWTLMIIELLCDASEDQLNNNLDALREACGDDLEVFEHE